MSNRRHLLYMGVIGVVALAGMWLVGVPLDRAVPWALLLACPLMMAAMMLLMNHGASHDEHSPGAGEDDPRSIDARYRR